MVILFLGLIACSEEEVVYRGEFRIEEIQDDPAAFLGNITLIGIVGDSETRDFSLQNESGTFYVLVDYHGSEALPQLGAEVVIEGELTENRPCCGPGFTIRTTRFDLVEE